MKRWSYRGVFCSVILLAGVMISSHAFAETSAQMTVLEKKLYEAAKKEGKLTHWDSDSLKNISQFIKAFTSRYPGIEVSYWEGNTSQSDEKYFSERQAGRKSVDVVQVGQYQKFKSEGCLANVSDIVKDTAFPKDLHTKDFDAVAIEHTVKGVSYNTKLISPKDVPRSWEALLDPKWKGKIAVEVNLDVFVYLTRSWGQDKVIAYLKKLKEQNPIFNKGVSNTMILLGAGEFPLAVDMSVSITLDQQAKGNPIGFAPISPIVDKFAPFALLQDAPHPNAGKLFLRWLMSPEGQLLLDKVRHKGNPLPGSGTAQSKTLEPLGIKVLVVPAWEVDAKGLQEIYQQAIGYTK